MSKLQQVAVGTEGKRAKSSPWLTKEGILGKILTYLIINVTIVTSNKNCYGTPSS